MEVRTTGKHDFLISWLHKCSWSVRRVYWTALSVLGPATSMPLVWPHYRKNSSSTTDFGAPVHSWLSKDYQISVRLGQEKTLTSWAAGWGAGTTLSLAFCALLSPAASAGAGGATTGGSTAAATAPSAGTTGTWSGMGNEERREPLKMAQPWPGKRKRTPS